MPNRSKFLKLNEAAGAQSARRDFEQALPLYEDAYAEAKSIFAEHDYDIVVDGLNPSELFSRACMNVADCLQELGSGQGIYNCYQDAMKTCSLVAQDESKSALARMGAFGAFGELGSRFEQGLRLHGRDDIADNVLFQMEKFVSWYGPVMQGVIANS